MHFEVPNSCLSAREFCEDSPVTSTAESEGLYFLPLMDQVFFVSHVPRLSKLYHISHSSSLCYYKVKKLFCLQGGNYIHYLSLL